MKLRWHAQVRTRDGAITTYIKVVAPSIKVAAERAAYKAWKQHGFIDEYQKRYRLSEWVVIYVGLYKGDHNKI